MTIAIAIDGPASSGKGTVARMVARTMNYAYIDTGAMYRSVALLAERAGVSLSDGPALGRLAAGLRFAFAWDGEALRIEVSGEDLSSAIRSESVGQGASKVSAHPEVRAALLGLQQQLGSAGGVVMEGRDIGTVVLPDAALKIFLDAELDTRAARRTAELRRRGLDVTLAEIAAEIRQRDAQDRGRAIAPLLQAEDAFYLDTTALTPEQVAARIAEMARRVIDADRAIR